MRYLLPLFLLLTSGVNLVGQNQSGTLEGTVTYITSQSVYVKFSNTARIKAGDTLFIQQGENFVPALKVKDLSSISCVCIPVSAMTFKVSDKIFFLPSKIPAPTKVEAALPTTVNHPEPGNQNAIPKPDTTTAGKPLEYKKRQQIHGFVNVASYSNFSNYSSLNSQKEKLTFLLSAKNLGNSNL